MASMAYGLRAMGYPAALWILRRGSYYGGDLATLWTLLCWRSCLGDLGYIYRTLFPQPTGGGAYEGGEAGGPDSYLIFPHTRTCHAKTWHIAITYVLGIPWGRWPMPPCAHAAQRGSEGYIIYKYIRYKNQGIRYKVEGLRSKV